MARIVLRIVLLASVICAGCGDDSTADQTVGDQPGGGGTSGAAGGGGAGGVSGAGGQTGGQGGSGPVSFDCGNGIVEGLEECDDGNDVEDDGCNTLCEFSCHADSDCAPDLCSTGETCDVSGTHTCVPSSGLKPDGEPCGDNMACYHGRCHTLACGNGIPQEGEDCDDGNDDDADGCTRNCRHTCIVGDEDNLVANFCDPNAVCDGVTHTWQSDSPLLDGTVCEDGLGYCLNGVCTRSICGDGEAEPNESCDLGEQNGQPGAACTADCTTSVCGDGRIDGDEQCDDGNRINADGCDERCKVELFFRISIIQVTRDPAPSFCKYAGNPNQGNAMGKLFLDDSIVTSVRGWMGEEFLNGGTNLLAQLLDLDDPSIPGADPLVGIGMAAGVPDADWASQGDKLDFPFGVSADVLDDDNRPSDIVPARVVEEGGKIYLETTNPNKASYASQTGGEFVIYDSMMRFEVDPDRSRPEGLPLVESIQLPESLGGTEVVATGVSCGALLAENFASMPLPLLTIACLGKNYVPCAEGQDPTTGACSSVLDMFVSGCEPFMNPIGEPDADIDGDGNNDAYSSVVYMSALRVKVVGVVEP